MSQQQFLESDWSRRDEMTRDLYVRYPRVLRQDSVRQHIAIGPGWFGLVNEFLERVNETLTDELANRFVVDAIEEAFGQLRIQYFVMPPGVSGGEAEMLRWTPHDAPDFPFFEIDVLKANVEQRSAGTCIVCGHPGVLRQSSSMHVSCDTCASKLASAR